MIRGASWPKRGLNPGLCAGREGGLVQRRPLLARAADPRAAATALLAAREPFYDRAHARIDTVGKRPEAVAEEVIRLLDAEPLA